MANLRLFFRLCLSLIVTSTTSIPAHGQSLLDINVSGAHGEKAVNGSKGANGTGAGGHGRTGQDASPPTDGKPAGDIELKIGEKVKGVLQIEAQVRPSRARNKESKRFEVEFGKQGYVYPLAIGGDGQAGGVGGRGGDGAKGSDGADATRFSSGGNGGPGGDGGDGGTGTNASQAGEGGNILMNVDAKDLSLLMLIEPSVKGGKGAAAGRHGEGGNAGAGGDGGSSYSWTETETETYTDSDGKTQTRTKITSHSNPGGSDGSSGTRGRMPTHPKLSSSDDAADGKVTYRVWNGKKSVDYESRYDLKVDSYTIESQNDDGVLEPSELVYVKDITVRNTGGMPTPKDAAIEMYIRERNFVTDTGVRLHLEKSLEPGESYTFPKPLEFRVKDVMFTPADERMVWDEDFTPNARQLRADRDYQREDHVKKLTFTFPVELEAISALRTLGPGEATEVSFRIKNISSRPFGSMSELKRAIEYYIKRTESQLADHQIELFTRTGGDIDFTGEIVQAISDLGPGQSTTVTAVLGVRADAPPFKETKIDIALGLDKPEDHKVRRIQVRPITIRTTQQYKRNPESRVLLVTNSEISGEVIESFRKQVEALGEQLTIWDLSYEGHLDLHQRTELNRTLMKDFEGGLIVVPTNEYRISSEALKPEVQLRKTQFLEAAAGHGIQVMFVGSESKAGIIDAFLAPTQGIVTDTSKSLTHLMSRFQNGELPAQTRPEFGKGVFSQFNDAYISRQIFWGKPKRETLANQAESVATDIARRDRNQRWVTVYNFEPEALTAGLWSNKNVMRTWKYGSITLIRSLDRLQPSGSYVRVNEKSIVDGSFAKSEELTLSLLQNLGFENNMKLLERFITDRAYAEKNEGTLAMLIESLMSFLAWEQNIVRDRALSLTQNNALKDMHFLKRVKAIQALVSQDTPAFVQQGLKQFAAEMYVMVNSELSVWDFFIPFSHDEKVSRSSRHLIQDFVARVFSFDNSLRARFRFGKTREDGVTSDINQLYKSEAAKLKSDAKIGMLRRFFSGYNGEGFQAFLKRTGFIKNGRDSISPVITGKEMNGLIEQGVSIDAGATKQDSANQDLRASLRLPHPSMGQARCEEALKYTSENKNFVPNKTLKLHTEGRQAP